MPSFEQDHQYLLDLSDIFEPTTTHHFDQSYNRLDELLNADDWDIEIDGPIPEEYWDCEPVNWYVQYWSNCAQYNEICDFNGYEFRELFEYNFYNNYSIWTGHPLDLY